jgi:heme oxygenase
MYLAWLPLEAAVESALQRQGEFLSDPRFKDILLFSLKNYFPRRYALQEDLKALGLKPAATEPEDPVHFPTPVALVGGLYVYFGARMGSRMIATKLTAALPEATNRFFAGTKNQPPGFWQSFKTLVDALELAPGEQENMVGSANEIFGCFRRALA